MRQKPKMRNDKNISYFFFLYSGQITKVYPHYENILRYFSFREFHLIKQTNRYSQTFE